VIQPGLTSIQAPRLSTVRRTDEPSGRSPTSAPKSSSEPWNATVISQL
jgi:hypothetical protein